MQKAGNSIPVDGHSRMGSAFNLYVKCLDRLDVPGRRLRWFQQGHEGDQTHEKDQCGGSEFSGKHDFFTSRHF